jgi:hypothetical protein
MPISTVLTQRQIWYRQVYLPSQHWQVTAAYFRKSRGYRCEECGVGSRNLDVHHNGYGDGYQDENGQSLLWRERERPNLMQVLCRDCHDAKHPNPRFPCNVVEVLEPWMTPYEARAEERAARLWEGELNPKDEDPDDVAWEIVAWERMCDLGLDPDDPDFSELSAEGLEGNEEGNYDDERDDRVGDGDPAYWEQDEDEEDLDGDEDLLGKKKEEKEEEKGDFIFLLSSKE